MNSEDKFFVVTYSGGLNIRSTSEVEKASDLGNFDLDNGDVIHTVAIKESSNGTTFHKFDQIHRGGTRYDSPFDKFPKYVASTTGEYWAAEKDAKHVWMAETDNPDVYTTKPEDVRGTDPQPPTSTKKYVGYRALHRAEGGYDATKHQKGFMVKDLPAVIPPAAIKKLAVDMTKDIQKMSFKLMQHFNSKINEKAWTKVHLHDKAFNNGTGFGDKKDPRKNFITGENISKGSKLPQYDKAGRLCAGAFVHGEKRGNKLVCRAGVHGIDAMNIPSLDTDEKMENFLNTILENNWYFYALTLYGAGTKGEKVGHFPQGDGGPVVIPFIFDGEIEFDLSWFEEWESDESPDPLRMYNLEKVIKV